MEKKMNIKHHGKHGQLHKPLDAFELYELEHMPRTFVKLSSDNAKSRDFEAFKPDYHEKKRTQHYWYFPKNDDAEISKESVDAESEKFIAFEHEKFEYSKWMSMNGY